LIIKKNKLDLYYKRLNYLNKNYFIKIINNINRFNNKLVGKLKTKNITDYKGCETSNFTKYNNLISFKKAIFLFIIDINTIKPFNIKDLKKIIFLINKDSKTL